MHAGKDDPADSDAPEWSVERVDQVVEQLDVDVFRVHGVVHVEHAAQQNETHRPAYANEPLNTIEIANEP